MKRLGLALSLTMSLASACVISDADTLHGALASLAAAPAATTRDVFTVEVTGTLAVNYTSPEPAVLEISVDGAVVLTQSLDVATALDASLAATVPLHEGPNQIVVLARYRGETLSEQFVVDAAMAPPAISLPTWTPTYTAHEGLTMSGTIGVAALPAYAVTAVAVSVDGGPWLPSTPAAGGGWRATITNPDLGDSDVAVRATTSVDGHQAVTEAHGVLTVAPVFDCTSGTSMLPDNDLIQNNSTEQRVMVGYFGQPSGGHDVAFVIDFTDENGDPYTVTSSTVRYGIAQIEVAWNVNRLRCNTNNGDCASPYALRVFVDGVPLCNRTAFGTVIRFN